MHQPIQWHEWGEEAFAAAKRENKPILLDIGAVWCHWCHVMDRESYESAETAEIINREFIAVKVDRDERPDVDSRYQLAVSAIAGTGGWPLTVFLTPDGRPFYGGTYFPPIDQWGRPSFKKILTAIADAYRNRREEVLKSADEAMNVLTNAENFAGRESQFSPRLVGVMVQSALPVFDEKNGGFGSAPKFPHPAALDLLMDWYARTGEERVATVITTTLTHMARGGVYDQLAGGFHRYSVDEHWTVPHFEKMSYDNSELLKNYVHGYQVFGFEFYAHVARDIIRWMDEWLSDREHGGFYASQDADINLDDDGDYFTWTRDEAQAVLIGDEFEAAALHYDIEATGEMHHNPAKNVLWVRALPEEVASRMGVDVSKALDLLASAKTKLYAARLQRPTPFIDKTVYVNWNAMCVSAYLQAAQVLNLEDARKFALRSLDRILAEAWDNERGLSHVIAYADGSAEKRIVRGMLDDYAFTTLACLDAYEVTGAISYFNFARRIKTLSCNIIKAVRILRVFRDNDIMLRFIDLQKSLKYRALGLLHPLPHGMKICGHDKRGRKNTFALLTFAFAKKLLKPFRHIKNIGIKRGEHFDFFAPSIKDITQRCITVADVAIQIANFIFRFGLARAFHQTLDIHA